MAEPEATNDEKDPAEWVPRGRYNEQRNRDKARIDDLETKLREAISSLEEHQDANKPDLERLTKENEKLKKENEGIRGELDGVRSERQRDQKASWLASAAAKANFHDPDIAARMVDLESIEDTASAERAVKGLAKEKSFLVKEETKQSPLERVGIAGTERGGQQQTGLITPEQQEREWGNEILKGLDPSAVPSE